jgi:hypothetical protein
MKRRSIEVACLVEIEQSQESFHAHAIPQGIDIRPGDRVLVCGAPRSLAFGERISVPCRAIVTRASWLQRLWIRATAVLELTELYEVGFAPREMP